MAAMRKIADAPRDGTPVLVRFKSENAIDERCSGFASKFAVMRNRGDNGEWGFAAPVGMGGFIDDWLDGWWPLPGQEPPISDADGKLIDAGDTIAFSFGIPPTRIEGPVIEEDGSLFVVTKGYNPDRCKLTELTKYVGPFWKISSSKKRV